MAFTVLLDTCVLYPAHLRDTVLRLAERGLFRPQWSEEILVELDRNLRERGVEGDSVTRLIDAIEGAFPDAMVVGFRGLTPLMTCDTKDRHVLAAAAVANHKEPREVHVNDVQG